MSKQAVVIAALVVLAIGAVAGHLSVTPRVVPPVYAAVCQSAHQTCTPPDVTKTSVLDVVHAKSYGEYVVPVQPVTGESWAITAYWNTAGGGLDCLEIYQVAYVDVDWNGSTWVLSNQTLTANIVGIYLCPLDSLYCSTVNGTHSSGYRLVVDITDPVVATYSYNLRKVVYATTSVDSGYELDQELCTLGNSVSPTSQAFSQTDNGGFECELTCSTISGPSLTISYQ
jgi:hypothetical protein